MTDNNVAVYQLERHIAIGDFMLHGDQVLWGRWGWTIGHTTLGFIQWRSAQLNLKLIGLHH